MQEIYSIFYNKQPKDKACLLPNGTSKLITFLNPYYIEKLRKFSALYEQFDYICSDGILPVWLNKMWNMKQICRISFDMTSLAKDILEFCSYSGDGVYFIGSEENIINKFVEVVRNNYPHLNIKGWHHGYIKGEFDNVANIIIASGANVVVVGMGAPMQDEFAIYLNRKGFSGAVYTCGGFFHQTTTRMYYYPGWVNRYNLRTFYRLCHERYVLGRVCRYYPSFIINYSLFLLRMRRD